MRQSLKLKSGAETVGLIQHSLRSSGSKPETDMPKDDVLTTTEFFRELPHTKDIGEFFDSYEDKFETEPFHEYLKRLCWEREILPAEVIKKSEIERTFGHHIFNGDKNPSRDKVLQLAFGFGMNCEQAKEL
jgi:hypothetical protein